MANNKGTTLVIRGKASYAKILGEPVANYNKDGKEWKMDLELSTDTLKELNKAGLKDSIKNKETYLDGNPYISFKQPSTRLEKKTGQIIENKPIRVVDAAGKPWDQDKLIGNGSVVDVKFDVIDWGAGRIGKYIRAVRVLQLVEYASSDFEPLSDDDEFKAAAEAEAGGVPFDTDMDDDIDL